MTMHLFNEIKSKTGNYCPKILTANLCTTCKPCFRDAAPQFIVSMAECKGNLCTQFAISGYDNMMCFGISEQALCTGADL